MVQHQINAEHARFEMLILKLKTEQDRRLEPLKAELRAVNKLTDVAAWQYNVRAALTLSTAVAAAAETSAATVGHSHADGPPQAGQVKRGGDRAALRKGEICTKQTLRSPRSPSEISW
jgi:hypothetical protein